MIAVGMMAMLVLWGVDTYVDKSLQLLECIEQLISVTIYAEIY